MSIRHPINLYIGYAIHYGTFQPMTYILTLVTHKPYLDDALLSHLPDAVRAYDFLWLSKAEALDIYLPSSAPLDEARSLLLECRNRLSKTKTDIFLSNNCHRRKKLLVADMDSTIVQGETLDELAKENGLGQEIVKITRRAMNGELEFRQALKERVALLKGLPEHCLDKTWKNIKINPGAKTLVATLKKNGAYCILISGGFSYFTEKVALCCGFDEHYANRLGIRNHTLTGSVDEPISDKHTKLKILNEKIHFLGLDDSQTLAVGDGANDIPMLKGASIGVGYYPKTVVKKEVDNYIEHTDLKSLLFLQGYKAREIMNVE